MLETLLYVIGVEPRLVPVRPQTRAWMIFGGTLLNIIVAIFECVLLVQTFKSGGCAVLFSDNWMLLCRVILSISYYFTIGLLTIPSELKQIIGWKHIGAKGRSKMHYLPWFIKAEQ
jgi:hypothetical protein